MKKALTLFVYIFLLSGNSKTIAQICFNPITTTNVGGNSANTICHADFNGDNLPDFAISDGNGIEILLQNGTGGFSSPTLINGFTYSSSLCTADFNGDGIVDLASFDYGPGALTILQGDGSGNFSVIPNSVFNIGIYNPQTNIIATDLNNDGNKDILLSTGFNFIKVLMGLGNGTFGVATNIVTPSAINGQLIAADFNNDGKMDVATKSIVLIGDGLGSFVSSSNYNPLNDPLSILTTDFNNDGNMDLATVNRGMGMAAGITGDVSVYLGDGSGGFLLNNTHGIGDSIVPPSFNTSNPLIVYGDFNNDQKNDLALTAFKSGVNYSSNIIIMLGDGLGGFAMPINIPIPNIPHAIIADDLNGDSKMDLAVLTKDVLTTCDLSILLNCNTTSLSDLDKLRIQLFPNPTNGRFEIVGTNDGDEISVVDILGKEVLKFNQQNQKRDFFIDRKGVYFVTIKSNKSNNVFKLVVND